MRFELANYRHPLLSFPYVMDAPWPDGSDNRFERGAFFSQYLPVVVTMDELIAANGWLTDEDAI